MTRARDLENECRRARVQTDVQVLARRAGFDGLEADLKVRGVKDKRDEWERLKVQTNTQDTVFPSLTRIDDAMSAGSRQPS